MGNAKLQYSLSQQESEVQPATTSNTQGAVEKINFVKTFDTPELANKFKKLIPKDFASKTSIEDNKITVADITDSQKKNLIASALQFISSQPKKPVKEDTQAGGNKDVKTYGDLKKVINSIISQKSGATNKLAQTGKLGVDFAIGSNPITNGIKTAYEFYKIWSNQPDTRKVNSWVSKLDIDDETSAIVDDTVEQGFIEDVTDTFSKMPDNTPLPNDFNMSVELAKYLKGKYKGKFVAPTTENKKTMKESIKDQIKKAVMEVLQEKKLSKAEKNKKEDIVKAMAKQGASKDSKTYAIATAKAKKLAEGEGDTSMDDILLAFQAALDKKDDAEQDQALKAVYNALKDKVKGKLGQVADYAKDKLTQYNDSLEEVDEPISLPTSIQTRANSRVVDAKSLAKILKDIYTQIQSKESIDFSKNQNIRYVLQYLDKAIDEKPAAEADKA
jgi:uncharacterized membrane protein